MRQRSRPDPAGARSRARRPTRARRWSRATAVTAVGLAAAACGSTPLTTQASGATTTSSATTTTSATTSPSGSGPPVTGPLNTKGGFTCVLTHPKVLVDGTPDLSSPPAIKSVQLVPHRGGLVVSYSFLSSFPLAPEGVYFSWTIFVYRTRSDAANPEAALELQLQDRGAALEPTGWSLLVSTYTKSSPVVGGAVRTDAARDELQMFFPSGFSDLNPPFFWFASQEVYRSFLPPNGKTVFGSLVTDCPTGVRPNPYSLPDPVKLLRAAN